MTQNTKDNIYAYSVAALIGLGILAAVYGVLALLVAGQVQS